jgi:hypothetical protein
MKDKFAWDDYIDCPVNDDYLCKRYSCEICCLVCKEICSKRCEVEPNKGV